LKAANILVDRKFRAKVADFGLSQKKQLGGTGTPFWMAPELLRKEAANSSASDVFSFGVILVEVYSRKDPYEGESTKDILKEIADKSIRRRPTVPDNCPPQIRSMISDCLVDEGEMRPTFQELDTRLKRIDAEAVDIKTRSSRINKTVSLFDIFPRYVDSP
jgi:serine/threonine protein kinase